jgi:hypothetical protein
MASPARALVLSTLLCLPVAALAMESRVGTATKMTAEGRAATPPTKEQPAYYFPVVAGFQADGAPLAGEKEPPQLPIVQTLAVELAKQNYFVSTAKTPPPTVMLVFVWGYVNPSPTADEEFEVPIQIQQEQAVDRAAAAPRGTGLVIPGMSAIAPLGAAQTGVRIVDRSRYIAIVSAYDYATFEKSKKKVLLWSTTMSLPMAGTTLAECAPRLIREGAPLFGREKADPIVTQGKVEIGPTSVVPSDGAAKPVGADRKT